MRLLVGPPGQTERIIKPVAIVELSPKEMANKKPIIGRNISWFVSPINTAFGYLKTLAKSSGTNDIPMPNMMIAKDIGNNCWLSRVVIILRRL
jgi:hypothetical protein